MCKAMRSVVCFVSYVLLVSCPGGAGAGESYMIGEFDPWDASSSPSDAVVAGDRVFFVAGDGRHGREVWVSDGTAEGTHIVADLVPDPSDPAPFGLTPLGDRVAFGTCEASCATGFLWNSDGTPGGTFRVIQTAWERPALERTVVGESLWRIYPFREFVDAAAAAIRRDPSITHCGDPHCARCNDAVKGGPLA